MYGTVDRRFYSMYLGTYEYSYTAECITTDPAPSSAFGPSGRDSYSTSPTTSVSVLTRAIPILYCMLHYSFSYCTQSKTRTLSPGLSRSTAWSSTSPIDYYRSVFRTAMPHTRPYSRRRKYDLGGAVELLNYLQTRFFASFRQTPSMVWYQYKYSTVQYRHCIGDIVTRNDIDTFGPVLPALVLHIVATITPVRLRATLWLRSVHL